MKADRVVSSGVALPQSLIQKVDAYAEEQRRSRSNAVAALLDIAFAALAAGVQARKTKAKTA